MNRRRTAAQRTQTGRSSLWRHTAAPLLRARLPLVERRAAASPRRARRPSVLRRAAGPPRRAGRPSVQRRAAAPPRRARLPMVERRAAAPPRRARRPSVERRAAAPPRRARWSGLGRQPASTLRWSHRSWWRGRAAALAAAVVEVGADRRHPLHHASVLTAPLVSSPLGLVLACHAGHAGHRGQRRPPFCRESASPDGRRQCEPAASTARNERPQRWRPPAQGTEGKSAGNRRSRATLQRLSAGWRPPETWRRPPAVVAGGQPCLQPPSHRVPREKAPEPQEDETKSARTAQSARAPPAGGCRGHLAGSGH